MGGHKSGLKFLQLCRSYPYDSSRNCIVSVSVEPKRHM